MKKLPLLLILFRLVLGPCLIALAYRCGEAARILLMVLVLAGFVSDIFDGIVARKQGVSTATLRRMDSQTDLVFWLCAGWCAWLLSPQIIIENKIAIITLFAMEGLTYVFSLLKFGKETCTHAWLSKLWGVMLCVAFSSLLGFNHAGVPFTLAVIFGVISHLDVYLIIFILPRWTHDVPSAWHAWQIRQGKDIKRHKMLNG